MANPTLLHNRDELEALFAELAGELELFGLTADVVMVGGAWMLWHFKRAATRDVDSAASLTPQVAEAVARVGARHGLIDGWLNDHAKPFWPATADYTECVVAYELGPLTVRVPPPRVVFLMKLDRADPQDVEDMILLWPMCDFVDADDAAAAYADAYPLAVDDPYMATFIADKIVAHAAT
jgi:hypothetical protein